MLRPPFPMATPTWPWLTMNIARCSTSSTMQSFTLAPLMLSNNAMYRISSQVIFMPVVIFFPPFFIL
jgi:hypothetical protein